MLITFNITLHALPCQFAALDLQDSLGQCSFNLTRSANARVEKRRVDANGVIVRSANAMSAEGARRV